MATSQRILAHPVCITVTTAAGRAYATYGGIYIVASLVWLWAVESLRPDRWDVAGASICLIGAAVILWERVGRVVEHAEKDTMTTSNDDIIRLAIIAVEVNQIDDGSEKRQRP